MADRRRAHRVVDPRVATPARPGGPPFGWLLLLALLAASPPAVAEDDAGTRIAAGSTPHSLQESRLVQSLFDIRAGRLEDALGRVASLVQVQPDFTLAHLVHGDLLAALGARRPVSGSTAASREALEGLRHEARARLSHYARTPPPTTVPASLLEFPARVGSVILVDLSQYRLYLLRHGREQLRRDLDFYVSIGKGGVDKRREGDEKTPVGVYLVNEYIAGEELPDLYGDGAFPISYPNGWDLFHGRTGSGIWIHGTESDRYSRPPLSSRGCVTLSNADFRTLRRYVTVDETPVVVAKSVEWASPDAVEGVRRQVRLALDRWRVDWESRDVDRYLSHYARTFRTDELDRAQFAAHKRRVTPRKRFIKVRVSDLTMVRYPGEADLVLVEFLQSYESDSFRSARRKQQFWQRQGGDWKIVFELGS